MILEMKMTMPEGGHPQEAVPPNQRDESRWEFCFITGIRSPEEPTQLFMCSTQRTVVPREGSDTVYGTR
jgi:hypothetical protein